MAQPSAPPISSIAAFPDKEYVDVARACSILGVKWLTVVRLAQSGFLEMIDYRYHSWKKIRYQSIVDFCDELRRVYRIPDRRPKLSAPYLRYRDEDLLPFPMSITMFADEALAALGVANRRVLPLLVEEGRFEAYRLVVGSPWRISRPSFAEYLKEAHSGPQSRAHAYQRMPGDYSL